MAVESTVNSEFLRISCSIYSSRMVFLCMFPNVESFYIYFGKSVVLQMVPTILKLGCLPIINYLTGLL